MESVSSGARRERDMVRAEDEVLGYGPNRGRGGGIWSKQRMRYRGRKRYSRQERLYSETSTQETEVRHLSRPGENGVIVMDDTRRSSRKRSPAGKQKGANAELG